MSQHLRQDSTCLNCGATVEERYCSRCGQENIEVKESFGHLFKHFFEDITHFDSKLFITLKDLIIKPGFLTREYLEGRRVKYLHPIKMYVFISFIYFLAALSTAHFEERVEKAMSDHAALTTKKEIAKNLNNMLSINSNDPKRDKIKDSTIHQVIKVNKLDSLDNFTDFVLIGNVNFRTAKEYDSIQNLLPRKQKENTLKSWFYHRNVEKVERYGAEGTILQTMIRTQHIIPKMMFVFLPLFALLMKLFYDRKKYLYVDHAIFSLHFHSFFFLLLLLIQLTSKAIHISGNLEAIPGIIYLSIALKTTYHDSYIKSLFKSLGLAFLYTIVIGIGFAIVVAGSFIF